MFVTAHKGSSNHIALFQNPAVKALTRIRYHGKIKCHVMCARGSDGKSTDIPAKILAQSALVKWSQNATNEFRLSMEFARLQASVALGCMEHRGACGGDYDRWFSLQTPWDLALYFHVALTQQCMCSGDGSGIMTMIPWELFGDYVKPNEIQHTGT